MLESLIEFNKFLDDINGLYMFFAIIGIGVILGRILSWITHE